MFMFRTTSLVWKCMQFVHDHPIARFLSPTCICLNNYSGPRLGVTKCQACSGSEQLETA